VFISVIRGSVFLGEAQGTPLTFLFFLFFFPFYLDKIIVPVNLPFVPKICNSRKDPYPPNLKQIITEAV
jgi:hypothetical protein